ncbi:MAG TPA: hypothetical protein DEF85_02950 [Clostridiaceae bacterium]|jgi:predicted acylesterase/phospholipase RssA|nr:hypothetical protein [Clostridiaceae bacterium]HBG39160.1 hypothetical protein [Clostridiaceae bacterium]HBN29501.1 hypothetical protein [Clostridiaceae bacterium]HBX47830.1 hypothetical protein [Clostridiaceae bacterium]HCL50252.1 hypothetical protein [Clostridiaceae bacterium]
MMIIGMCLIGGGAKGAFQGGALKRFHEANIEPQIVTGTSIGAFNGYFVMKGSYNELEKFYIDPNEDDFNIKLGMVIDNSSLIDYMKKLEGVNQNVKEFFVNYVNINNQELNEKVVNVKKASYEKAIDAVKYSSLLPARLKSDRDVEELIRDYDTKKLFDNFKEDVKNGIYDGYNLDGGILNNNFLEPFKKYNVDKLIIIGLKDGYMPPDYIYNFYNKKDIIILRPDIKIKPRDTIRFEKDFLNLMFERGYVLASKCLSSL